MLDCLSTYVCYALQVTLPSQVQYVNPCARPAHERGQNARAIVRQLMQQRGWKGEDAKLTPAPTLSVSLARLGKPRKAPTAIPTEADILKSIS